MTRSQQERYQRTETWMAGRLNQALGFLQSAKGNVEEILHDVARNRPADTRQGFEAIRREIELLQTKLAKAMVDADVEISEENQEL